MTTCFVKNFSEIINVELSDVDMRDYPKFCDAFVESAEWKDGTPLSEKELDELNDNHSDVVYDCVVNHIKG